MRYMTGLRSCVAYFNTILWYHVLCHVPCKLPEKVSGDSGPLNNPLIYLI